MAVRATILWIIGLVTLVPYGTYYLLYQAAREEYALVITLLLFWIFGYWGVLGPLLTLVKVRSVFRRLEEAQSPSRVREILESADMQDVAVNVIAAEYRIPRFLATRVYHAARARFGVAPPGKR